MSPVQSVELLLDADGDLLVRRQWQLLAEAGLPSQARHTGASNAPHITLAVRQSLNGEHEAALENLAAEQPPWLPSAVRIGALLVFPSRRATVVLARSVVAGGSLLALHARVDAALSGAPEVDDRLAPDRWQAHVTLARGLATDRLGEAVGLLSHDEIVCTATTLRRWDGVARRAWTLGTDGT